MNKSSKLPIEAKFHAAIDRYRMIAKGDHILAAVSGGADSMCLLKLLIEKRAVLGIDISVCHVNHGLRGEQADDDENFVRIFCEANHVAFNAERVKAYEYAKSAGMSVEEAGRVLRYRIFAEKANFSSANKIALAHHSEDVTETMLFSMFRGSGIRGMCGIPPCNGQLIRPLINTTKDEIYEYLRAKGVDFREDPSNDVNLYTRNIIRNRIMPVVTESINTGAGAHMAELASQMRETYDFISKEAKEVYSLAVSDKRDGQLFLSKEAFFSLDPVLQKELLFIILERTTMEQTDVLTDSGRKDITSKHIGYIISLFGKQVGKSIDMPRNVRVKRCYGGLAFEMLDNENNEEMSLAAGADDDSHSQTAAFCDVEVSSLPAQVELVDGSVALKLSLKDYDPQSAVDKIPKNKYTKWFDYDKISETLAVRFAKSDDFLQINKSGGTKSVFAVMKDHKIPLEERSRLAVLCAGSHCLWIPAVRSSEAFLVDQHSQRVLIAKVDQ